MSECLLAASNSLNKWWAYILPNWLAQACPPLQVVCATYSVVCNVAQMNAEQVCACVAMMFLSARNHYSCECELMTGEDRDRDRCTRGDSSAH